MDIVNEIGSRVRTIRISKGMTQEQLAEKAGLTSKGHVSEIENGNRKHLQARTIQRLARGLGVDIKDLLEDGEGELQCGG